MAFIGEIRIMPGNVVPTGWALCDGQILPVAGNGPLFDVLGYRFGGNGSTTFGLPDLRGRVPIGAGQGPGLNLRDVGESAGVEAQTLSLGQIPSHRHALRASTSNGASYDPANGILAGNAAAIPNFGPSADTDMAAGAVAASGTGQPHNNMQPFLTLRYMIALTGDVP
jgi:microcystin-dependent protein